MNSESLSTRQRSQFLLLAMVIALAAVLRCFSLSSLGFWTDELCTLSCSHGWGLQFDKPPLNQAIPANDLKPLTRLTNARRFVEIIPAMARDEAHPPLYFLLLRLWENLLGDSEAAVRSLDVIFSLLAIVLLFFTARESVGATTALWACLIMAVAEPQIQFSQEARNYMPVVTFSLLAALAIQQIKRRLSVANAIILAGSLLAMMLTHYFAAGVAVALAVFAVTTLRRRALTIALTSFGAAAVLFLLIWGPFLYQQLPHFRANYAWVSDDSRGHLGRVALNLLNLPWRLIAELPASAAMQFFARIVGAGFFCWVALICVRRRELRLWGFWLVCAMGVVAAVDLIRSTAQLSLLRYTLFATPALYVLIAAAIRHGRWRWVPPVIAVVAGLMSLKDACTPAWKIDFRTPADFIARNIQPGDGLIIIGRDPIADGVMYSAFEHDLQNMPVSAVLTQNPDEKTLAALRQSKTIYIFWRWPDPHFALPGFRTQSHQAIPFFADVEKGHFGVPGGAAD